MAMSYMQIYLSYRDVIAELTDEEAGRLIKALLAHAEGEAPSSPLGGERLVFKMMAGQYDRDRKRYEDRCEQNRRNIEKRWNKTEDTTVYETYQEEEKEERKQKEKRKEKEEDEGEGEKEVEGKEKEKEEREPTLAEKYFGTRKPDLSKRRDNLLRQLKSPSLPYL